MRNKEYRDKLLEGIKGYQKEHDRLINTNEPFSRIAQAIAYKGLFQTMLKEYDRLHPDISEVKKVEVKTNGLPYGNVIRIFDNLSGCNITLIDNVLNVEIE